MFFFRIHVMVILWCCFFSAFIFNGDFIFFRIDILYYFMVFVVFLALIFYGDFMVIVVLTLILYGDFMVFFPH